MKFPPKNSTPENWVKFTEDRKKKKQKKKSGGNATSSPKKGSPSEPFKGEGTYLLFGRHPVFAALANPNRKFKRLLVTQNSGEHLPALPEGLQPQVMDARDMGQMLSRDSVHQGYVAEVYPLPETTLDELAATERPILMLDQVTDPHNIGAILRSAAAFDAAGVITLKHNAPEETGVMAKSASGAMEIMPVLRVPNLVQAIETLKKHHYWVAGLDGTAEKTLAQADMNAKTVLVLGAEGAGLRRLTTEHCDLLVKLPISPKMESLNVSNAAAIALYELNRT